VINAEAKDNIAIVDSAVISVFGVVEDAVVRERAADIVVGARLMSELVGVGDGVVPLSPLGLVVDLGESGLRLSCEVMICYAGVAVAVCTVRPLSDIRAIS